MRENNKKKRRKSKIIWLMLLLLCVTGVAVYLYSPYENDKKKKDGTTIPQLSQQKVEFTLLDITEFCGEPYVVINENIPFFSEVDINTNDYEVYSQLDDLGRCGTARAYVGEETMPTEERGEIGHIKPSGWNQAKYFGVVDSAPPYLYNRCHLIAFCLTGENDNEKNLITGTRYLNVEGMLPWEEKVAKYVDDTGNHVIYRVTPDFRDDELLARGVLIEAYSIEDDGQGVCFCVYCYNVQPGVVIDYMTGESWLDD